MPGEFLPPVVTRLEGNIDDLRTTIAEAKALIKSLGDTPVTVQVKFDVNNRTLTNAIARTTALTAAVNGLNDATSRFNRDNGNNVLFAPGGGGGGNRGGGPGGWWGIFAWNPTALHATALGIAAVAAAIAGTAVAAGSLAAVWGSGASHAYQQMSGLVTATQATIPPGVPDYALARAFGITSVGPNSPLAKASQVGNNQVLSALGGLVAFANKNGPLGNLVAGTGVQAGAGLDNFIAKMDLAATHGQTLQKFMSAATTDAYNMGAGFANLGMVLGHVVAHMPGEIEWLTTGFRNVTGWANQAFHVPVLNQVLGDAIFGGLLLHGTALATSVGAKGLNALGGTAAGRFLGLGGITGEGTAIGSAAGMGTGALMFTLPVAAAAAALGAGLAEYRHQNPTSAAIRGINANLFNTTAGNFLGNIDPSIGLFSHGAATGSTSQSLMGWLIHQAGPASLAGFLSPQKWLSPSTQNANALWNAQQAMVNVGGGINAVARALHISTAEASMLVSQSGVKVNAKGQIEGGNAQAVRLVQNWLNGNRIVNGQTGEALANMNIGNIVGDSAWKAAGTINSNWDTYMGAMTGGGIGLGNLGSVLSAVSPSVAANLQSPTGIVPTSQGIQSAGQSLVDFFRQAQSVGAIGGKSLQQSILQVAASMGPLAGNSKAAQAQLVALANESGLNIKNFGQLMQMTGGSAKAEQNLANSVASTTAAFAKMPAGLQAAMTQVQNNISGVAAAIVQKFPAAYTAFNNMTSAAEKFGTGSTQAQGAAQKLAKQLEDHGMTPPQVLAYFQQLGIALGNIKSPPPIIIKVVGQISGNSAVVQAALASGAYFGGHLTAPIPGHAAGTRSAPPGFAWVGERGPELMHFMGGETVIPHEMSVSAARGYANGVGMGDIHNHIYIDGKEVQSVVKQRTFQSNVNNGNRGRDGRVNGNFRPRP